MAKGKEFKRLKNRSGRRFKVPQSKKSSPDYDLKKPIFSFRRMKYQGNCCISKCESNEKTAIVDKLLMLSQLTWKEIRGLPKESGFEILPQYRFNYFPENTITPEVPILVARYDRVGRIAGFRINDIYHIILAGKDLYPH